jgi:hypothetical protein
MALSRHDVVLKDLTRPNKPPRAVSYHVDLKSGAVEQIQQPLLVTRDPGFGMLAIECETWSDGIAEIEDGSSACNGCFGFFVKQKCRDKTATTGLEDTHKFGI